MRITVRFIFLLMAIVLTATAIGCRNRSGNAVTIALSEKFGSLDTLTGGATTAADDRVRTLIFNSLIRKNEKFEYVGEIGEYKIGDDNLTITYTLRDGIKFHNGKTLTSGDVKYSFDTMFASTGSKRGSFFEKVPDDSDPEKKATKTVSHFTSIETPDPKTIVFKVSRPALINQTLSNLVTIPIIPEGTGETQKTSPLGSGPFKFVNFDSVNNIVRLEGYADYWEGAPKIPRLVVKTIPDASALQNELLSGGVDIAPNPTNLSPDSLKILSESPLLKVERANGSNVQYIGFNTQRTPFNDVRIRQAVAYAIDREKIIKELFNGQAKLAHSILPEESWAYSTGTKYTYDPAKAKKLLQDAGYKGEAFKFKYVAGNSAVNQYSQIVQNSLREVGFNVELETLELQTLVESLKSGQFEINTAIWIGGNQDPIFFRDLFASTEFPDRKDNGRNRARYSNPEFDKIIEEAVNTVDKEKAKQLYLRAQEIISNDVPLLPLWYPSSTVIASKKIGNIKINASGDWSFVKDITVGL
ncbi:MAG: ABC transporter substrate-binding protein [Acidobacteria bacterium]|nr:ABC transporter substrate-binding protein [Acidobacteriota bacterium]MBK8811527.1 ABC transporter substrate-binding protein [Acidobacteriota bacterium]